MQTMQHCCCLISNLNDTRGCIHPIRPAVRTRHTNRLNPGNNRGIRNVPLPNTSMLDKYAQSIEHAASPAGRPSHCHTGNDVTAPSMRADRLLREAAGAIRVIGKAVGPVSLSSFIIIRFKDTGGQSGPNLASVSRSVVYESQPNFTLFCVYIVVPAEQTRSSATADRPRVRRAMSVKFLSTAYRL